MRDDPAGGSGHPAAHDEGAAIRSGAILCVLPSLVLLACGMERQKRYFNPSRPRPGSLSAGRRRSSPATAFSRLISTPSTHPRVKPPYPPRLMRMPVRDGDSPIQRRSTGKSLPMAVGGSVAAIPGAALMIAATNVLEVGPGQAR